MAARIGPAELSSLLQLQPRGGSPAQSHLTPNCIVVRGGSPAVVVRGGSPVVVVDTHKEHELQEHHC